MGSPVSAIIANIFMEWLEKEAIASAPMDCRLDLSYGGDTSMTCSKLSKGTPHKN